MDNFVAVVVLKMKVARDEGVTTKNEGVTTKNKMKACSHEQNISSPRSIFLLIGLFQEPYL